MASTRQQRVAAALREKLSVLLLMEVRDPRLEGITVTEVEVDRELQTAKVFVNALGDEDRKDEVIEALDRAGGFLRRQLSEALDLRKIPELRFEWDTAFEQAARIDDLIDSLDIPDEPEEG